MPAASLHDQAAVDAERLARHVPGAAAGEEGDHVGHVLRALHPSERHLRGALPRELRGREAIRAPCSRATTVHMSVSTNPGQTQFTRIPSLACARARLLVM